MENMEGGCMKFAGRYYGDRLYVTEEGSIWGKKRGLTTILTMFRADECDEAACVYLTKLQTLQLIIELGKIIGLGDE